MPWKRILIAAGALSAVALLVLVLWPAALAVDGAQLSTGAMQVTVDDQGETRSHDRFVLSAPVAGRLARIALHDGDAVGENQLLAQIAPLPLSRRELDEITARVASAEAIEREAQQRVRHADEDVAQAGREYQRVRKLVQDGFMAPQAVEQARNLAVTAASEAEAARFRARAAAADVKVAKSGLGGLRAGAQAAGSLVPVRAPMAGRILRIPDASERVVMAGTPLLSIGNLGGLEVVIELLSSEAVKVAPGMPVLLEGWGGNQALRAKVRRVEPYAVTKVSALGIEEKRVNVIADFVDPPGAIGDGFRVTARIVIWQADKVLKVPASALFRCAPAWCVFVVEDGRARRRSIEVGQRNLGEAEVTGGLSAGQTVVRYPGNDVTDGARVRLREKL
ncbi:MAG: efflux RND transporter periplasmic adaptor subunit [Rhodoferax sp.]|uniref:efflux RND transporter periplasmic adaptor subunit n=1 Tax=Rhodoferax sp. TaxID=50421 RepID=UPI00261C8C0C|nr:efflux RND transporter periplasmic adaptor subunit [Rhodoferax sp.]MDD5333765.1 efflux RND transporter periplasmic adaptor subunit [Rhodoferax sp.]